jgi:signal peptidase I
MKNVLADMWSFLKTVLLAGFLAFFVIRGFVFEPFKIPSSSMMPTLLIGDYLVVSKFAFGNRLPLTDWFFWQRAPQRGDIVVFKRDGSGLPGSFFGLGKTLFIKRLVGLPGDEIAFRNQTLTINGKAVLAADNGSYALTLPNGQSREVALQEEDLLGVKHAVLRDPAEEGVELAPTIIPAGQYVMMGDNRDNSRDSRFWQWPAWGFVPQADLMGRAEFIVWSWDQNWAPRWGRMLTSLRHDL